MGGGVYRKRRARQQGHEPRRIIKDHVHLTQDLIGQNILYPYPIIALNIITEQVIDLIRSRERGQMSRKAGGVSNGQVC